MTQNDQDEHARFLADLAERTYRNSLCEFTGCKHKARWLATKLWGKGGTIRTCDKHKPRGDRNRPNAFNCPDALRNLPAFYRVEPMPDPGNTTFGDQ